MKGSRTGLLLVNRFRTGFTLVEVVMAAGLLSLVILVLTRVMLHSQRGFTRGQDILTGAQHLALIESHIRSDLAAVDGDGADVSSAIGIGEGRLSLLARRGKTLETVCYSADAGSNGLMRTSGAMRTVLAEGYLLSFSAALEIDVTDHKGVLETVTLERLGGRKPVRVRVRMGITVRNCDEAGGSLKARPRTLTIVSTPIRLNRKLASSWPRPRPGSTRLAKETSRP